MTGQKASDLPSRLGVRRSKTTTARPRSSDPSLNAPPKASAKRFNDMLHPRTSKERDRARRVSDSAATRSGAAADSLRETSDEGLGDSGAQKIAELEQALAVALEEQNTMREELLKLKEHGQVYRETIDDYRRSLASTYETAQSSQGAAQPNARPTPVRSTSNDDENTPRISTRSPPEGLVEEVELLRLKITQLQDQLMTQDATYRSLLEDRRSRAEVEWEELRTRLHSTEKESDERLQQLLSLKSAFSSLTRSESQVADSELSETFSHLFNRVREWVISNYRRAKLNFSNLQQSTAEVLKTIFPSYGTIDQANRLALFQAIVSSMLMYVFEESLFVGLPETGPLASLRQIARTIGNAGAGYQNWRHATIRSLQNSEATSAIKEERARQTGRLASGILHLLHAVTSHEPSPEAKSALHVILSTTMDFQNTLLLQKARYRVEFMREHNGIRTTFDENRMDPVNELDGYIDDDEDMVADCIFVFCVFPCLEKFGNEYGEHTEVSNVLVKAKVCCSVE